MHAIKREVIFDQQELWWLDHHPSVNEKGSIVSIFDKGFTPPGKPVTHLGSL